MWKTTLHLYRLQIVWTGYTAQTLYSFIHSPMTLNTINLVSYWKAVMLTQKQRVEYGAILSQPSLFYSPCYAFFLFGGPWKMYNNHKWALNWKGRELLDYRKSFTGTFAHVTLEAQQQAATRCEWIHHEELQLHANFLLTCMSNNLDQQSSC